LWWAGGLRQLSRGAARTIAQADRIGIPSIVAFEVAELFGRRRIELGSPLREWLREALAQERVELLPLSPEVAVDAAQLGFTRDPFDRVIYATARAAGARLVTRDERMRKFDPELTVW
jgi:PIN domain nuclease of toxin-antitoxin system